MATRKPTTMDMIKALDPRFVINRQGTDVALYKGLLALAHDTLGIREQRITVLQFPLEENGGTAVVHAHYVFDDGSISEGIGDADSYNVGKNIVPHKLRMASCVPLDARILTRGGFRYHDELSVGEPVLAYDVSGGMCRWTPLRAVNVFNEPQPVVRMRGHSFDAVCTPDHSWVSSPQGGGAALVQARGLRHSDRVVVSAPAEGGDSPLTEREAALLGWLATGGWAIRRGRGIDAEESGALVGGDGRRRRDDARTGGGGTHVSECPPQGKVDLIESFARALIARAGWNDWTDLPRIVTSLGRPARAAMLNAMLKGGAGLGKEARPGVRESLLLLATLEGKSLVGPTIGAGDGNPSRAVRVGRHIPVRHLSVSEEPPVPVWCPTTDFGTWVMDYRGFVTVTGNTRAQGRALRDRLNIGGATLEEFGPEEEDEHHRTRGRAAPGQAEAPASAPVDAGAWAGRNSNLSAPPPAPEDEAPLSAGWGDGPGDPRHPSPPLTGQELESLANVPARPDQLARIMNLHGALLKYSPGIKPPSLGSLTARGATDLIQQLSDLGKKLKKEKDLKEVSPL